MLCFRPPAWLVTDSREPIADAPMTTLNVRQTFALVVLFVATSLTFIQLDNRRALDPVKSALHVVVSPITRLAGRFGGPGGPDTAAARELELLRTQNEGLLRENATLKAGQREIEQLRQQAGLQAKNPAWSLLQARVMNTDPTNASKIIVIDKGSDDGVAEGMAVVARENNYIGLVTEVSPHTARVTLIIDDSQRVGARLESGADGVVSGMWQKGGRLTINYVDRDVQPVMQELVLTADDAAIRTDRVPGGLLIGRVEAVAESNPQGDAQTINVLPMVDFEQLSVVTVVLSVEEG